MTKSVRFFGGSDSEFVELSHGRGNSEPLQLLVRYEKDGTELFRENITSSRDELLQLAQWLDDLWDECPPATLAQGRLQFIFSHREHIGEGYYRVEFDSRLVLSAYEQLGASNTLRAEQVRTLAG